MDSFIQWTNDESIFSFLAPNNEVLFFEKLNPDTVLNRIRIENLSTYSLNPISKCVAVHASGKKSEPSFIRLYKFPDLTNAIANKSFFNSDRVEFKWSKNGHHLLMLCSTEVSQNSYYGDTTLHYLSANGESQIVQLSKKGPIYSLEWNPMKDEFIVVYGTMPAKATLFNSKCDAIYDFGTGPRNECYFSPHGNIVCLAGFGNLAGRVEFWNLSTSNKVPQEICTIQADDTTMFRWCPDGEHVLTATTAPRLRVSNGFKIWNYLGEVKYCYKLPGNNELWQVEWQPGSYPTKPVVKKTIVKEETKAYVPPHLRNSNRTSAISSKLHQDDEKPDKALKIKPGEKKKGEEEDKEKKVKNIKKKLAQIDDLKKRVANGEKLEKNQLDKLKTEDELVEELEKLSV